MSNEANLAYSVEQDEYAYSTTGQIGTQFLAPCVALIVLFSDNTVMLKHMPDLDFANASANRDKKNPIKDGFSLFKSFLAHVKKMKKDFTIK